MYGGLYDAFPGDFVLRSDLVTRRLDEGLSVCDPQD